MAKSKAWTIAFPLSKFASASIAYYVVCCLLILYQRSFHFCSFWLERLQMANRTDLRKEAELVHACTIKNVRCAFTSRWVMTSSTETFLLTIAEIWISIRKKWSKSSVILLLHLRDAFCFVFKRLNLFLFLFYFQYFHVSLVSQY